MVIYPLKNMTCILHLAFALTSQPIIVQTMHQALVYWNKNHLHLPRVLRDLITKITILDFGHEWFYPIDTVCNKIRRVEKGRGNDATLPYYC